MSALPANPHATYFSGDAALDRPFHTDMVSGQLEVAGMTHQGGRRENQDRFLIDSGQQLLIVADGVGGLKEGGLAAELACQSVHADLLAGLSLERAVSRSTAAISKEATLRGIAGGMASTIVAVQWSGTRFQLVWVGDSSARSYWSDCCHRLTRDHSEKVEWASQGIHTESTAMGQPRKHVLTQALGVTTMGELRLGRNEGVLRSGEWLMLASDGVTNTLSPEEIASCLDQAPSVKAAAQSVMERTLESRPTDNATLILAKWLGAEGDVADLPRVYPD